ncbi:MAG: 5-formyltetrahydrofolate cyclo-ligase [Bacteroidales bacterium]
MELNYYKQELRDRIKHIKKTIRTEQKLKESETIFKLIEQLPEFKSAKTVLAYWSLPDEVVTHNFIMKWYKEKQVLLPVVVNSTLEIREFSGMECMVKGKSFGILEPSKGKKVSASSIDFGIIPGVAFDSYGNRLGRGKGFYDKLLMNYNFLKVGVCFSFQLVNRVPTGSYDIKMNKVIHPQKQ